MSHAIIQGKNGRRHEVDFGEAPIRVELYASGETIEIFVEADYETLPEDSLLLASRASNLARPQETPHAALQ